MTIPNFFIAGGPKCGTTSLYEYLKDHPQVFLPAEKEPRFFCYDLPAYRKVRDADDYLALFDAADPDRHIAIGDASPIYLFSRVAIPAALEMSPGARFIAMLRNPVEMAYSLHSQFVYGLTEDVTDFEAAWRLQGDRRGGRSLPPLHRDASLLQYRDVCSLGEQVGRLLRHVERERVLFILFDDLRDDVARVYADVLQFLGLQHDGKQQFPVANRAKELRYPWLARALRLTPRPLKAFNRRLKQIVGVNFSPLAEAAYHRNRRLVNRPPLRDEFIGELREAFSDDILLLSRLVGRDLSTWLS